METKPLHYLLEVGGKQHVATVRRRQNDYTVTKKAARAVKSVRIFVHYQSVPNFFKPGSLAQRWKFVLDEWSPAAVVGYSRAVGSGKSCAQSENSCSEEGHQQRSGVEVPRINFPTLIDVRGPYVFSSDASELCVFAPAETETSNPRYVRIEGFQQEWLNEPFAKRFLSAITGLGWMQPNFAFDPLRAIWTHPSDPLPHCLGVFDYSEDELQKMQRVKINGQLFQNGCTVCTTGELHVVSFCTVMQRLVGLDMTNNVHVDAACIEASLGKYKVLLHLPVPLSVQFGKRLSKRTRAPISWIWKPKQWWEPGKGTQSYHGSA